MALQLSMKLIGANDLKRLLEQLEPRVRQKYLKRAVTKASEPVIKTAKAKAPRDTGLLRKSIGRKVISNARRRSAVAIIGPRIGMGRTIAVQTVFGKRTRFRDPVKYAHLVEFGTAPHIIIMRRHGEEREILHTGSRPQPFLRPAMENNRRVVTEIIRAELRAAVLKEAKRK